jgi:hypothetical protein
MELKLEEIRNVCRLRFVEIHPTLNKISSCVSTLEFGQFLPVNTTSRHFTSYPIPPFRATTCVEAAEDKRQVECQTYRFSGLHFLGLGKSWVRDWKFSLKWRGEKSSYGCWWRQISPTPKAVPSVVLTFSRLCPISNQPKERYIVKNVTVLTLIKYH